MFLPQHGQGATSGRGNLFYKIQVPLDSGSPAHPKNIEGGTTYIADRKNMMWEIQTDNPNVLTNKAMRNLIAGMKPHDLALWPVFKTFIADSDYVPEIGLRLRAKSYLPKINEVLMGMRQEGINMDWVTIQLKIALMSHEKGAQGHVSRSEDDYDWSTIGRTIPSMIQRGLRQHPTLYVPTMDFCTLGQR